MFAYKLYDFVLLRVPLRRILIEMRYGCPLGEGAIKLFCPTIDFYVRLRVFGLSDKNIGS